MVERVLGDGTTLLHCASRSHCARLMHANRGHAILADPLLLGQNDLEEFVTEAIEVGIPVVVYTSLDPRSVTALLPLLAKSSAEVALADIDEDGQHLRSIFDRLPERSMQAELLCRVAVALMRLPLKVAAALITVLLDPTWVSAKQLPARTGVTRRTIDRTLLENGCATLKRWSAASRLSRVVEELLRNPVTSPSIAARLAGFGDLRSARKALKDLVGSEGERMLESPSRTHFLSAAARCLKRRC